ncbi:MAG: SDR family oxidoreductase [Candidatus Latescibacteria bacterium]|jgi:3-oxoacyl-[acyl-carrier protein] reductase|nr:SDR family oxidoreductase [Candidatus Latescibacterota bacterium]
MRLSGKVAIITGAGRGIGRATALAFADAGASIVVVARTRTEIDEVADQCREEGAEAIAVLADVSDRDQVLAMAGEVYATFRKVDILVNNAGVALHDRIPDIREEDFDRTYQVNTKGVFLCTQAVFGRMCEQGSGHIVNVSSTSGKQGSAGFGSYAASKFAVIGFTQATHAEGQPHGVKASVVCPGPVDTVMRRNNHPNDIIENLTQPEEIADAILHLVCQSPKAHTPEVIVRTPLRVS